MTLLLGALIGIAPFTMDIYLASMPSMTHALAATPEEVQLTLSVYMYGWGFAQLVAGPLSDRHGRRPALLYGLAVFVAASIACALSRNVYVLIAARLVQALSLAPIAVVPRAIVRDLHSGDKAAHMLTLMGVVLGIAPVAAPIIGSHVHVLFGWQANFVLVALYGAVLWAFVLRTLPETLARRDVAATRPAVILANYGRLLRSRTFRGYMLVAASGFSGLFAFIAGSAFVFVSVLGEGERGFGLMFGVVMLGNITGSVLGSRLVRRLDTRQPARAAPRHRTHGAHRHGAHGGRRCRARWPCARGRESSARDHRADVRLHGVVHADDAARNCGCADSVPEDRRQRIFAARVLPIPRRVDGGADRGLHVRRHGEADGAGDRHRFGRGVRELPSLTG